MIALPIDPYPTQPKFTSYPSTCHSCPFTFTKQPKPTLKFCIQIRLRAHRLALPMRRLPCLRCTAFCFPLCKPLRFLPPFALSPRANLDEAKEDKEKRKPWFLHSPTTAYCYQPMLRPTQPTGHPLCVLAALHISRLTAGRLISRATADWFLRTSSSYHSSSQQGRSQPRGGNQTVTGKYGPWRASGLGSTEPIYGTCIVLPCH
ncbi:uncharacterized protein LY79DRAFT_32764 [Colletotrichum navitas]|uniref:Uncharacterized protein n=1 Tax=Colletotrichum navitas TaxID=681940 RepID=A0AAD8Q6J6_9PEZI|nr:uncharacterized protein LY79DRAFT_32764 [Colletotrichum navitas]KAK1596836.1 hypothetical protein LY79DRAFT_32764 [Colletotrichum navitas]